MRAFVNEFDPVTSSIGGLFIGIATLMLMLFNGEILGMSGITRGAVMGGADRWWRWAFLLGLQCAAALFFAAHDKFEAVTATTCCPGLLYPFAGLLVGVGTQVGGGCTSGHMICGNARLSRRSMVATLLFMAIGVPVAVLFGLNPAVAPLRVPAPDGGDAAWLAGVPAGAAALYVAAWLLVRAGGGGAGDAPAARAGRLLAAATSGALFGFGIAFGGMLDQAKVLGFLDVRHFNPSLACVAGAALGVALVGFQRVALRRDAPVLAREFHLPKLTEVTFRLVCGAALFGLGWALTGLCPGPALGLLVFSFDWPYLLWVGGFAVGAAAWVVGEKRYLLHRSLSFVVPLSHPNPHGIAVKHEAVQPSADAPRHRSPSTTSSTDTHHTLHHEDVGQIP